MRRRIKKFLWDNSLLLPVIIFPVIIFLFYVFLFYVSEPSRLQMESKVDVYINDFHQKYFPNAKLISSEDVELGTIRFKVSFEEFIKLNPSPNYLIHYRRLYPSFPTYTRAKVSFYVIQDGIVYWCEIEIEEV